MLSLKKILICSLGSIGRRYVRLVHELLPSVKIAVYRSGYGASCVEDELITCQFYSHTEALRWKPDAVIIASPASVHIQQALEFSSAGVPLLIEKPLGTGFENELLLRSLVDLTKSFPILLGYVFRHDNCVKWLKNKYQSGVIGDLVEADFYCGSWLPDWRPNTDYRMGVSARKNLGGGVLLELSHEFDLANFLLDETVYLHSAFMSQSGALDLSVEDRVVICSSTNNGAVLTFRLNFCTNPPRRTILLRGTKGELSCDTLRGKVVYTSGCGDTQTYNHFSHPDERFRTQLRHFIKCIADEESPVCTVHDGINVLNLIHEIRSRSHF